MTSGSGNSIEIRPLDWNDAPALAALMADYAAAMGGTVRKPKPDSALRLFDEPMVGVVGAWNGGALVAFALFFDLPEAISGERAGQLDDLYVSPNARGHGLAKALIAHLTEIGRERNWVHLRWLVPEDNAAALRAYEEISETAPWQSRVIWLRRELGY
ncbi:GNAT family N-acetyltransferase [Mesorhizobium loti]|nr:GNAT family N-acetyltransferase [Mesorhizobium loti]PLP57697.1 GNAT family N-acetyltransferase [Mesorhizobium loti]